MTSARLPGARCRAERVDGGTGFAHVPSPERYSAASVPDVQTNSPPEATLIQLFGMLDSTKRFEAGMHAAFARGKSEGEANT